VVVQDRDGMNLYAGRGVAVREFPLAKRHGFAAYLLFVDGKPVGVLEAKPAGHTLSGVQVQAKKYAAALPDTLIPQVGPLPFLYVSTGTETQFTNLLDPEPRSRRVFDVHRSETLAEWLSAPPLAECCPCTGKRRGRDRLLDAFLHTRDSVRLAVRFRPDFGHPDHFSCRARRAPPRLPPNRRKPTPHHNVAHHNQRTHAKEDS
jgi:hypothetical protein